MAFITINYNEEGRQPDLGYKSVEVSVGMSQNKGSVRTFDSGDVVKDWFNAIKFVLENISDGEPISHSSSVDHFISDGANKVDSAYLHTNKVKTGELLYLSENTADWINDSHIWGGIELFVPEGEQWTWEQLKEYCK